MPSSIDTPYLDALSRYVSRGVVPFHTPGHKQGRGAHPKLTRLMGLPALQADLSDVAESEAFNHDFTQVLRESERLAARAFGTARTLFLANGTTSGVHAMLWATCGRGDRVLVARDAHRSAFGGLALAGARPVYLPVETHPDWGISFGIDVDGLEAALDRYPDIKAVLLTSPNYYGVASDIRAAAEVIHARRIPLLVDQAHGPHLRFHPSLPAAAQESGADLVADSTHKLLGALTQGSMLHVTQTGRSYPGVNGGLVEQVERAVDLVQSSSPSPLLFASLDAARAQMEEDGFALLERTLQLSREARARIGAIPGLRILDVEDVEDVEGARVPAAARRDPQQMSGYRAPGRPTRRFDPTKLLVQVSDRGWTGPGADRYLRRACGIQVEMHGPEHILALITIGDTEGTVGALADALAGLGAQGRPGGGVRGRGRRPGSDGPTGPGAAGPHAVPSGRSGLSADSVYEPEVVPREAVRAPCHRIPRERAVGRIAAESITPYPPGIPLWTAGERITPEAMHTLETLRSIGGLIRGAADSSLETLRVLAPGPGECGGERVW